MDLSQVPADELRAELRSRDEAAAQTQRLGIMEAHRCPECGALPEKLEKRAVEEFRFAPRDSEGRAILCAPYESEHGTTEGMRWLTTVTCENGHVTEKEDIKWFDEAHKGPPLLPRR